ncbi:cytochrome c oxidase accessory protein CcoG [Pseudokordiimonas caeni]|uniref:cytochrome c oxidase accessory protein CcoG n=1 Tax=Pseudokordiimonas caeni TaxID=2997908 RepID=UPI0028126349|nr:cytochrome c oxidase accessory protein CcoG [Pseudokordiimonas caeni]
MEKLNPINSPLGTPDAAAVNRADQRDQLYADRKKVYPRRVYGQFRMIKWVVMALTLSVYYLLPWIRFDRGPGVPDQAFLIDFPTRKAYFFGLEIWAQEVYYATGLLILAALGLFLTTSAIGRAWCGYACPQTVWTDLFVHIERWIQGDRNQRMKLDKSPWGVKKLLLKVSTHLAWLVVAALTGGAFVFYFGDAPTLAKQFLTGTAPLTSYLFAGGLTFSTYLLGGIAREQVCIYMCPWPRIQGALVDENTLLVSYDKKRGEPRGSLKAAAAGEVLGDCIDCKQCVAVCPTGIDIRDGFQLECIQCALCVDACNGVMDKIDRPRNLIRYAPEEHVTKKGTGLIFRARTFIYMGLIVLVGGIMLASLIVRADLDVNIIKDRNPLFVRLSSGDVRNGYVIRLMNKQHADRPLTIRASGLKGLTLRSTDHAEGKELQVSLPPDDSAAFKVFAVLPAEAIGEGVLTSGKGEITFEIVDMDGHVISRQNAPFNGPRS